MTDTWTWLVARDYDGANPICIDASPRARITKWNKLYGSNSRYIIDRYVRPAHYDWDGAPMRPEDYERHGIKPPT